ncbi:MAG: hypothetical protein AAFQ80_12800 [Cyanobacteria bacterium J06621_8]
MELSTKRINEAQFDLVADIRFGKHEIPIRRYGRAIFGLKKGKLIVKLTNGETPLRNIKLNKKFQTVVEVKVQQEKGKEGQITGKLGGKTQGIGGETKQSSREGKEYTYKAYQVNTEGGLEDPTWVFECKIEKFLEGILCESELACIDVKEKPCSLLATFEIKDSDDIYLVNGSLFWQKDITKTKTAVIYRMIVNRLVEELLQEKPYLSRQELVHG